jgi:hypothetical protein
LPVAPTTRTKESPDVNRPKVRVLAVEVASHATAPTPDFGRQEVNFIDAASAAGVSRRVRLSGAGSGVVNDAIHRAQGESERRLQASGIRSVLVKPVVYMSSCSSMPRRSRPTACPRCSASRASALSTRAIPTFQESAAREGDPPNPPAKARREGSAPVGGTFTA